MPLNLGGIVLNLPVPNGWCVPLNSGGFVPLNCERIVPLSPLEDAFPSIMEGTVPPPLPGKDMCT